MIDLDNFDAEGAANPSNTIFGLPFTEEDARLLIVPVPWEVTVSYDDGTARAFEHIFKASMQVDLYDSDFKDAWKKGIFMLPAEPKILNKSDYLRNEAELYIDYISKGEKVQDNKFMCKTIREVNEGSEFLNNWLYERTKLLLQKNKLIGILGGDHSVPYGYLKALAEQYQNFGILQIDAHCDLREAYEGFTFSHASIMYNVLKDIPQMSKLVQLGIRDFSESEMNKVITNPDRVKTFFNRDIKYRMFEGEKWGKIADEIVAQLPDNIYVSFDIDGLTRTLCPHTGTPVLGGLYADEVFYLFHKIKQSKKRVIGFDLVEVGISDSNWDANVGARMLWKLSNLIIDTN